METDEAAADGEPRCPLGTLRAWAFSAFCRFGERLAEEVCEGAGERPPCLSVLQGRAVLGIVYAGDREEN
jgi:hypothetical protein